MATPKPGEIRCPTCHRSTPPASFCTQCGSAIPTDARIRPRGLDRDELQERIRARRVGADPFRRGAAAEAGYERFQPEPEDLAARQAPASSAPRRDLLTEPRAVDAPGRGFEQGSTGDLTRDGDEWDQRARGPVAVAPMAPPPLRDYPDTGDADAGDPGVGYAAPAYGTGDYSHYEDDPDAPAYEEWEEWEQEPERRSAGAGALAILGFLALGVLALLGGAVLAGVFGEDPQVGVGASPSPSLTETVAPATAEPTPDPIETPDQPTSQRPGQSNDPVTFPDGFEAEVQPCLPGSANINGCNSNGSTNSGALDVWVGFRNGNQDDVISAEIVRADGSPCGSGGSPSCGTGTIPLSRIGCTPECRGGWTYIPFSGLPEGEYEVRVTRNGEPAGETTFVVS